MAPPSRKVRFVSDTDEKEEIIFDGVFIEMSDVPSDTSGCDEQNHIEVGPAF